MNVVQILFGQDDEAREVVHALDNTKGVVIYGHTEESVRAAVEHLSQWDTGDDNFTATVYTLPPVGWGEKRVEFGGYVLTWHTGLGYYSFDRIVGDEIE